ncbi:MAG TPA: sulfatase-like hydrolase/transferase, partial [Terracidiphilus sp.]|nr:sulfatase-like hydrolase/transferase [Terracidiphilus sp.]
HTGLWRNEVPDKIQHSASLYTDCFIDHLMDKAAKRDTPFFMYLGFNSPHDPRQAPREYVDMYPQDKIEVPPDFLPVHPFDQGDFRVRDEMLAPFPRTREAVQLHRREYYALITYVDAQIGRILDALERSGKADNTGSAQESVKRRDFCGFFRWASFGYSRGNARQRLDAGIGMAGL